MRRKKNCKTGTVGKGDIIVLTIGDSIGKTGDTNTMKIVRVGDQPSGDRKGSRVEA